MSCYHPLKGFILGQNPITGKNVIKIVSSDFTNPEMEDYKSIEIPCGHCIGCYLDRSRQWADRCMLELQYHERSSFVTLTYDDDNLPDPNYYFDSDTGEAFEGIINPLVKKDLQNFIKRLRSKLEYDYKVAHPNCDDSELPKIRYFGCGEYGSLSQRPHYHLIIFGEDFSNDRQFYKRTSAGFNLYNSPLLSSLWTYGYAITADVTWDTCAYVARYVTKKINGNVNDFYDKYNVPKEFTIMSRKPGIGRQFYDEFKDVIYDQSEIYVSTSDGARSIKPSRYYDSLYDIDNPLHMEQIKKDRREKAATNKILKRELSSKSYLGILKSEEDYKLAQTKILKRKEV